MMARASIEFDLPKVRVALAGARPQPCADPQDMLGATEEEAPGDVEPPRRSGAPVAGENGSPDVQALGAFICARPLIVRLRS